MCKHLFVFPLKDKFRSYSILYFICCCCIDGWVVRCWYVILLCMRILLSGTRATTITGIYSWGNYARVLVRGVCVRVSVHGESNIWMLVAKGMEMRMCTQFISFTR